MRTSTIMPWKQTRREDLNRPARRPSGGSLPAFNRQVLEHQDAAYTLAYYLLGVEETAAQIVQAAVSEVYHNGGSATGDTRLMLLRAVARACARRAAQPGQSAEGGLPAARLMTLPAPLRCAALLVDVLGLTYAEAARVLDSSSEKVGEWLAQARLAVMAAA